VPTSDWQERLAGFEQAEGQPLSPVEHREGGTNVPETATCAHCGAPAQFLYFNDGKLRRQIRCKVCNRLSQLGKPLRKPKTHYWCPHCKHALYRWKRQALSTIYKCDHDHCPVYLKALSQLNANERELRKTKSSQFKLRYQYREYHFSPEHLRHPAPNSSKVDLDNIHNTSNVLGLVLAFHVSFAIAARKTAFQSLLLNK
jgi:hypothetical protein